MIDQLLYGDCLQLMKQIPNYSIDMILCDLPYGTTRNKWDCCLPLDELWSEYRRIIKPRGAIVLFAQTPFDKVLGASNLSWLKYEWIWSKNHSTGFLNSRYAPLKKHENILVFSPAAAGQCKNAPEKAMIYHPQYRKGKSYFVQRSGLSNNYDFKHMVSSSTMNDGNHYYPVSILDFKKDRNSWHPTQKPIDLCRYLIRTYTNVGGLVLDNCSGSGSSLIAAYREHRHFIGMELDKTYFDRSQRELQNELSQGILDLEF